jgi:hypothetical protein
MSAELHKHRNRKKAVIKNHQIPEQHAYVLEEEAGHSTLASAKRLHWDFENVKIIWFIAESIL